MIFSDENMHFLNGTSSSGIVKEITDKKKIADIPFYLVTAYDSSLISKKSTNRVDSILEKPLARDIAQELIKNCFSNMNF